MRLILLSILFFWAICVKSQSLQPYSSIDEGQKLYMIGDLSDYKLLPPSCILVSIEHNSCKRVEYIFRDTAHLSTIKVLNKHTDTTITIKPKKKDFISVHGNIMYDYFYQSHLDTPYLANNIQQQTLTTFLDVKIKDEYPLRIYFTTRFGNTNYLRNITNLNFQYSPQTFINTVKDRIRSYARLPLDTSILSSYRSQLNEKIKSLDGIKNWLNDPSILQKLVEEREAAYVQKHRKNSVPPGRDTLVENTDNLSIPTDKANAWSWLEQKLLNSKKADSTRSDSGKISLSQKYAAEKKKMDSLENQIGQLESKIQTKRDSLNVEKAKWNGVITRLKNQMDVRSAVQSMKLPDSVLPKGYKTLLAVQKFGIGTSVVNYSELSAKDVTISGLQVEYNPRLYYAVAGGIINYRFRDYLLPETPGPKQYLGLIRFGKQNTDSGSIIFTYYFGRKMLYNYYTTDSLFQTTAPKPDFNLMGFTIEKKVRVSPHTFLTAEVAKSSLPYYHITTGEKQFSSVLSFSNRSNEAYSIKVNSTLPATQTVLEGYFKHYGANFQSFTLISTNSAQNAFLLNVNQPFFNKQLRINASIRKNDYIDPFVDQRYVSNTIFKSIQATLTIRHLPVISAGFYPITQLTKLNNVTYSENLFYTLTANASYMYNTRHTAMNTTLIWMRFYNRPTDSGFVYFNTNNFLINHSIFFSHASLQTSVSYATNTNYALVAWGENLQVKAAKWLSLGGGLKYNKQNIMPGAQIGYEINGTIQIPHFGSVQIRGEKAYIPGPEQQLVPDNTGRITYYRSF